MNVDTYSSAGTTRANWLPAGRLSHIKGATVWRQAALAISSWRCTEPHSCQQLIWRRLIPHPRYHSAIALGVAAATVAVTRRPKDALPILAGGILIDLDHLLDVAYHTVAGPGRFFALAHGWEYVLALICSHRTRRLLAAGLAVHLALDQLNAPRNLLVYWVSWRLVHRFRWDEMRFKQGATEEWKNRPWWTWF